MSKSKPAYRSSAPALVTRSPEYLTKELAAKRLGLSVRRVLELSARGRLKRCVVVDPATKRKQTVFRAADVAVIDGQRRLMAYRGGAAGADLVAALPPPQASPAPPQAHHRPWLTVEEAADYSGLPASFLVQMIAKRRLPALDVGVRQGGRFRISRRDIDAIEATTPQVRGRKKP